MKAKSADLSFHLHATEDGLKVGKALKDSLGIDAVSAETLHGHNGNIIMDNRAALGQPEAEALLDRILRGLSQADRAMLREELGQHIDERGTFFVRLDKQELVKGRLSLAGPDAVRITFRLVLKGEKAEELIRECLT